jgi:hypothetical protein
MQAKSIKGKSPEEIQASLAQSMEDGFQPTLAIVFLSIKQDSNSICKILDNNNIAVFGATTNGEFIDEETEKGSIAILLLDINKDYFRIYIEDYRHKKYREVAEQIAQSTKQVFKTPAFCSLL